MWMLDGLDSLPALRRNTSREALLSYWPADLPFGRKP